MSNDDGLLKTSSCMTNLLDISIKPTRLFLLSFGCHAGQTASVCGCQVSSLTGYTAGCQDEGTIETRSVSMVAIVAVKLYFLHMHHSSARLIAIH